MSVARRFCDSCGAELAADTHRLRCLTCPAPELSSTAKIVLAKGRAMHSAAERTS